VILYAPGFIVRPGIQRVVGTGLRLVGGESLLAEHSSDVIDSGVYGVFDLEAAEPEFEQWQWDSAALAEIGFEEEPVIPHVFSLSDVARAASETG
jgi:hypothetical protein